MQTPRLLTAEEFNATRFEAKRVTDGKPPLDFWDYVERIPAEDFGAADCREGNVSFVYRMGERFEHILINSQYKGLAMVIVVDLESAEIYGHHLLDASGLGLKES